jgi:hypothetical protein
MVAKNTKSEYHGLTERQKNIIRLRNELNTKKKSDITPFTKYKMVTYILMFLLPPYAMYRVWKKTLHLLLQKKLVKQCFV